MVNVLQISAFYATKSTLLLFSIKTVLIVTNNFFKIISNLVVNHYFFYKLY